MIRSKKVEVLAVVLLVVTLLLCWMLPNFAQAMGGVRQQYESSLFGADLVTVDIRISDADWQDILENPLEEAYHVCDVVINGTTFANVGIRTKGNTSLSEVANSGSDRYSFKLEFDHYQDGQTCWGLDKLVLNNLMADATYIKEYLVYDMFAYLDVPASLYSMAQLTVNGENWGVYLALEGVEDSFLTRNFGTSAGDLYKPENMGGGGPGGMRDKDSGEVRRMMGMEDADADSDSAGGPPDFGNLPDFDNMPDFGDLPDFGGQMPGQETQSGDAPAAQAEGETGMPALPDDGSPGGKGGPGGGMFGSMFGGGGSDLVYTDDSLDSYETIWEGAVTNSNETDHARVVAALKQISAGDLEGLDVDLMCRYMAVQTFVVNLDSLSGNMAHNYYLYEKDGKVTLLPWDYNLAFGGFMSGDADTVINFPIDTPVSGVSLEDRPIFAAILNDDAARETYHSYLRQLCEGYVNGGQFAVTYQLLRNLLDSRAGSDRDTDPTAFYTAEAYEAGVEMLKTVIQKRAESILGQLDGTIPATTDGQSADPDALVDASDISISVMGQQGGGGMGRGGEISFDLSGIRKSLAAMTDAQRAELPELAALADQIDLDGVESLDDLRTALEQAGTQFDFRTIMQQLMQLQGGAQAADGAEETPPDGTELPDGQLPDGTEPPSGTGRGGGRTARDAAA